MRKRSLFIVIFYAVLLPFLVKAQGGVWLQPNRGQWNSAILYRVPLTKGNFFVEKNQFTFALDNQADLYAAAHDSSSVLNTRKFQTIRSQFVNASWGGKVIESDSSSFYKNYFLGKDRSKWKTKVHAYKKIKLVDFYPGIHLIVQTTPTHVKYSFEVEPHVDPSIIKLFFKGMSDLSLKDNQLTILTRFGPIIENGLQVFTKDEAGNKENVAAQFKLNQDSLTFKFPDGYDHAQTLIIDPNLVFSTFTGSTADNWGFTATPGGNGDLVAGGIVFGVGYPISTGAYDSTYNNGVIGGQYNNFKVDIGISKFSSDGSQLLYSTLLGGTGNETPNSIITDNAGNLYILGISSSTDFPTTASAYQSVNHGGTSTTNDNVVFNGTDIIISKISPDGTQLLASTYLGGAGNDGLNQHGLDFNYGDVFRGDIIIAPDGNILFASSSQSTDFPIVSGFDNTLGGAQDAVVCKISPDLSNLIWSTYFGGSGADGGYSIAVSSNNNIYVTGGTNSTDLSFSNGHTLNYQGGLTDGYIMEMDGVSASFIDGTYVGTPHYDQSYFVDIDQSDNVYIFGQSNGSMPISANVFNTPNSGQFIQQYSSDLSTINWSTVVGGGNGNIEISPTAFMVSDCNEIYYTGWGGVVNQQNSLATMSTTYGFPTTSDAYQSTTNGSNFYIGVLSENAADLVYGTFMGGTSSSYNHVDGGTSRFDKDGTIYHAVCGGCGGNAHGFVTTPGAYSETNNSFNCNLAAWKFDLMVIHSAASIPDPYICLPDSAFFTNDSQNGNIFHWDFGDGTTSNEYQPHHYYANPGTYQASLIVSNTNGCILPDTAYMTIVISEFHGSVVQPPSAICPGGSIQLEASGGTHYQWSPAQYLDDPASATPTATVDTTTVFSVIVTDSCGIDTLTTTVNVYLNPTQISNDTSICLGDTVKLWANGGANYLWSSPDSSAIIGPKNQSTILVSPQENTLFIAQVETNEGCQITDSVSVFIVPHVPYPNVEDTLSLCKGDAKQVTVTTDPPTNNISWSPNQFISPTNGPTVTLSPPMGQWYYVTATNICGASSDSIYVDVIIVHPKAGNDTTVCPGEVVNLWASGGVKYDWIPNNSVFSPHSDTTKALPKNPTTNYQVNVGDENDCWASASVKVKLFPDPYVIIDNADIYALAGDEVQLSATGSGNNGTFSWSPTEFLSCVNCSNPSANPRMPITYTVTYEDENGCIAKAATRIHFDPLVYVPNTFTPDGDGRNNIFYAITGNIQEFRIRIFNRWGELVFESHDPNIGWDGTYHGKKCPDGTYVWKIRYKDNEYMNHDLVGHINVLR